MATRKSPRAVDVARWVSILSAPIPPHYGGAALAELRQEVKRARAQLRSWDLDDAGQPRAASAGGASS